MIVLDGIEVPESCRGGMLAIGNFDGVHRGHQRMVSVLVGQAKQRGIPAVVFTFDPPPVQLLRPDAVPPRLTTLSTKASLLEQQGVDCLIAYPTNLALLQLGPREFFEQIVLEKLAAQGMVEGPNFFFGKNRQGDVKLLAQFCESAKLSLTIIEPETTEDRLISSSRIRDLLIQGDIQEANQLLGRLYCLEGRVQPGERRGRTLGFPTANLGEIPTLIPGGGVYAGWGCWQEHRLPAAVHIGPNPTFGEALQKVEVHLLETPADLDLYGQTLYVELLEKIRPTQSFPNAEALKTQIENDLAAVRTLAKREYDR